ncbi:MAG: hypothetical protein K5640_02035 [Treponema sp.]|nr:hypothetical protein [Treponema sp.]
MNTSSVYIHSLSALSNSGRVPELREGDFVSVRVLSSSGNFSGKAGGTYTLSFAGQRFSAYSDLNLSPGTVFKAQILLKDGKLNLVPQNIASLEKTGFSVKTIIPSLQTVNAAGQEAFQAALGTELASFFTSLGLVPDSVTLKIFQQLQQLGAKIDTKLMAKVRAAALKFSGKEFEAAEAALLLEEKGIESSDEAIQSLLDCLEHEKHDEHDAHNEHNAHDGGQKSDADLNNSENSDFQNGKQSSGQSSGGRKSDSSNSDRSDSASSEAFKKAAASDSASDEHNSSEPGPESVNNNYYDAVTAFKKQILEQDCNSAVSSEYRPGGILTLFNHLKNTEDNSNHWVIIPFSFSSENASEEIIHGKGTIKLFLDTALKTLKKAVISYHGKRQEYTFVLYYSYNNKCLKDIVFSIQPKPKVQIEKIESALREMFSFDDSINIEWSEEQISPFSTENTSLNFAEGRV